MTLGNGKQPVYSEPVTEYWITHFNNDMDPYENWDVGEIVGFSLGFPKTSSHFCSSTPPTTTPRKRNE